MTDGRTDRQTDRQTEFWLQECRMILLCYAELIISFKSVLQKSIISITPYKDDHNTFVQSLPGYL